jgi:hypothetical protein
LEVIERVEQALTMSKNGSLAAIPEVKLGQDVPYMAFDRIFGNHQVIGYFTIARARGQLLEHL